MDTITVFGFPPGNAAWSEENGISDFVQILTEVLREFGEKEDFGRMMERTTQKIHDLPSFLAGPADNIDRFKLCTYTETTLTKKLYFKKPTTTDEQGAREQKMAAEMAKDKARIRDLETKVKNLEEKLEKSNRKT